MRYVWIGFHVIMLLLLVAAFGGVFSPPATGDFAHDNGSYIPAVIGIVVVWIAGTIIFRMIRRLSKN